MVGKYAAVISALPRTFNTEPAYQEKVEAVKAAMAADPDFQMHAAWLAQEYAGLRDEKAQAEAVVSEINLRLEAVKQLMAEQFESEGIASLKTASGRGISVYLEPYATLADREAFRQWCEADPDLRRKMMLPWQTTSALTKERLLAGEPEPPGIQVFAKMAVRLGSEK
jgi:hypothetical protein